MCNKRGLQDPPSGSLKRGYADKIGCPCRVVSDASRTGSELRKQGRQSKLRKVEATLRRRSEVLPGATAILPARRISARRSCAANFRRRRLSTAARLRANRRYLCHASRRVLETARMLADEFVRELVRPVPPFTRPRLTTHSTSAL